MADTNNPTLPKDSSKELGQSGTLIYQGIISGEEYNRSLIGKNAIRQYEIMRRSDATVHSALQVVKLPLLATTWDIAPASDVDGNVSDADKEIAAFVKRELFDRAINWHDFQRQALSMLDFGYSCFEKVYETTDFEGKVRIGLAKLASRKQTTIYSWSISGDKPGITQRLSAGGTVEIPREKLIIFTNEQEGQNYEGVSLLRYAYKDWDIKDKLTLVNAVALEKMGVGIPIVSARDGETPSPADWVAAEEFLDNMRANEQNKIRLPSTMQIEMLDMKSGTTKEVIPTLQFHNRSIYASILATFMDLGGSSGSGAKSLAGDLTSLFMKAEEAVANTFVGAMMADVIQQLCDFNFSDMPNGYPQLTFGAIADDNMVEIATAVNQLMSAGALTADPELEDHIRSIFRFPQLPEEMKDLAPTKDAPPASNVTEQGAKDLKTKAAIRTARNARQKLIDTLVG